MTSVTVSPLRLVVTPSPEEERLKALLNSVSGEGKAAPTMSAADQLADELQFKKRFGFSMNSAQRKSLLALKAQHDLTDDKIKHFKITGNLKVTHKTVGLNASRWAAIMAQLYVMTLTLITATVWWFAVGDILKGGSITMVAAFVAGFFIVSAYFRWTCIVPWQLQKRLTQQL